MELTFADKKLAETCNSRRLISTRWGNDGFERLAERLFQLAAVRSLDDVSSLPSAAVDEKAGGAVRIVFDGGEVVVTGTLPAGARGEGRGVPDGELCIERIEVGRRGGKR
jgi:hypothetical protein